MFLIPIVKFYRLISIFLSPAIELTCNGQSGHGSAPLENTPGEKVRHILDRFMDYRSKELSKISDDVPMGDVTNVNLTMINGGVQTNVVPADIKLVFDIRLAVGLDQDAFEALVRKRRFFMKFLLHIHFL